MNQQPLYKSDTRNVYNEITTNTIPTIIGNEKVLLNQTSYRNVRESSTINTFPFPQNSFIDYSSHFVVPVTTINATPIVIPGGISFTFPNCDYSSQIQSRNVNQPDVGGFDQSRLQYEMALKQLEQQMLQNMIEIDQSKLKQTQLVFHLDAQTSTFDLPKEEKEVNVLATQTTDVEMKDISVGDEND